MKQQLKFSLIGDVSYTFDLKSKLQQLSFSFSTPFPTSNFLSCDQRMRERERQVGGWEREREKGRRNLSADLPPLVVIVFVRFKHCISFLLFFFFLTFLLKILYFCSYCLLHLFPFSDEIKSLTSSKSKSKQFKVQKPTVSVLLVRGCVARKSI